VTVLNRLFTHCCSVYSNSAFHPFGFGKWGEALAVKAKAVPGIVSVVNKDLTFKAKAKAKAKDSKFVLEDTSRPRTKAKDNNTGYGSFRSRWQIKLRDPLTTRVIPEHFCNEVPSKSYHHCL